MTTVLQAITSRVSDTRTRLAMTLGALLEGGTLGASGFGVGDNGTSFGPFQIHLPAHPGVTAAQAKNPRFAVDYMAPAYQAAVDKVPAGLWNTDPERAAEQAAYLAERPAQDYYTARGASTVHTDYAKAKAALAGQGAALPAGGGSSSSAGAGTAPATGGTVTATPTGLLSGIGASVGSWVLKGVLVLGGVGLVAVGLYRASGAKAPSLSEAAPLAAAVA